jgi:imidazole glycerol phosphate synthase glutamine amidotransferase subunit
VSCITGIGKLSKYEKFIDNYFYNIQIQEIFEQIEFVIVYSEWSDKFNGYSHLKNVKFVKEKFSFIDNNLKIPNMGWNEVIINKQSNMTKNIVEIQKYYFVHSYHAHCSDAPDVLATVDYGGRVVAAIGRDNIVGTQFHPEKSHHVGEKVLFNFLKMQ